MCVCVREREGGGGGREGETEREKRWGRRERGKRSGEETNERK